MRAWPRNPVIYEINTWVWLGELSRRYQRPVDLGTVPAQEWDVVAARGSQSPLHSPGQFGLPRLA